MDYANRVFETLRELGMLIIDDEMKQFMRTFCCCFSEKALLDFFETICASNIETKLNI